LNAGDVIAELENPEIKLQIARLEGEQIRLRQQVATLQGKRRFDPAAAEDLAVAQQALADIEQRLIQFREDADRLRLRADRAGQLIPAIEKPAPSREAGEDGQVLATWHGTPFESRNLGATMEVGTFFCLVGDPQQLKATILVPDGDIELIHDGQSIELLLDEIPWRRIDTTVREIAEIDNDLPPRELTMAAGGPMATQADSTGAETTPGVTYAVDAPINVTKVGEPIVPGFRGRAKITVAPQSVATRVMRTIRKNIHFR
ncbi:MAG: hypothetical protein AAGF97_18795, partial [Planctomycetota bacterium]